ncbi:MAG: aminopeptidase PepB, partial [Plesiomonas shigelloides]
MSELMSVFLSTEPADSRWGDKALLSMSDLGVCIHLQGNSTECVQKAARKLDGQGIRSVRLAGDGWDLETCWAFHQGFRASKGERFAVLPTLPDEQQRELNARIRCGDWVRDTINLSAEELGPQQLSVRAAAF